MSPFDLTGGPFLQLYAALFVLAFAASLFIPRWLRPEGRVPRATSVDELAFLAGGRERFIDALVSRLLARQALAMVGKDRFEARAREAGESVAERNVLALSAPTAWPTITRTLQPCAQSIEQRLIAEELLMDRSTALQMRFWPTLPYLLLLGFGAIKWDVGVARDKPVGFLTIFLVVTAVFALVRFIVVDRRTRGGHEVLADARKRSERLRRAPTAMETDTAVALFGTAVLAGSGYASFHTMRTASSGGDGGSSSSDGGSGCGGGGGGGCGGCGGS